MKEYPTISKVIVDKPIWAFDKLDGSNIRAEWTPKRGFNKFGTRSRSLDPNEETLGEAVQLFHELLADELDTIFRKERFDKATAYFEFYGENSFAGLHAEEQHTVSLFDVFVFKKGFIEPNQFVKLFDGVVPTPELLYTGKANSELITQVHTGTLEGMTFEGVVCKGGLDSRNKRIAFKIKNKAWIEKLKTKYGENTALFNQLA